MVVDFKTNSRLLVLSVDMSYYYVRSTGKPVNSIEVRYIHGHAFKPDRNSHGPCDYIDSN